MDLQHLRASDGTGEAVLAHIQSVRNPGSTVLDLDNVDNWNTKCVVITGTPAANGFVSPVGMKVMYGHITAGDFIIDGFAPGYTDNGNTTSEVAIVKMTTSWADALVNILQTSLNDNGTLRGSAVGAPQGFMMNGKIQRTVASNNITVAVKTLAGTDPSATNPVYVRIGDTIRSITAALSITLNAGTNWFGVGASYFGGNEGDFFTYLIWNTNTSLVSIGIAREPDMRIFSDRDATSTNYGHLAVTGTAPAATDELEVVGRFNAILGVSASYNWSLPATAIVINRPIFETREFSYANTGGAGGTFYFRQVGQQKELYGSTGNVGTGTATITFPTGFFGAVKRIGADATGGYSNTNVVVGHIETHGVNSMGVFNIVVAGSSPSNPINVHVKGT